MTVRQMIIRLIMYPMNSQVVDTNGNPIMFMKFHSRENNDVRLVPKSQINIDEWLDDFFQQCAEEVTSDRDACDELKEQGFTLEDIKQYSEYSYEWAKQYWD